MKLPENGHVFWLCRHIDTDWSISSILEDSSNKGDCGMLTPQFDKCSDGKKCDARRTILRYEELKIESGTEPKATEGKAEG